MNHQALIIEPLGIVHHYLLKKAGYQCLGFLEASEIEQICNSRIRKDRTIKVPAIAYRQEHMHPSKYVNVQVDEHAPLRGHMLYLAS